MAAFKPFKGIRPAYDKVSSIAALPYDVYNKEEARQVVADHPLSFLQIDRGETLLAEEVDMYSDQVYEAAEKRLHTMIEDASFIQDEEECFYIYELERLGQIQRGLVGLVSAKEYEAGIIKKHENTREKKEKDRIKHIDTLQAHTGPIFLTYKSNHTKQALYTKVLEDAEVIFEFVGSDQVRHKGYKVASAHVDKVKTLVAGLESLYIADGHHRAASAVKIAQKYNYKGEYGHFLAVVFPDKELNILAYNRVVKDLNGLSVHDFLDKLKEDFSLRISESPVRPKKHGSFGMYLVNTWYELSLKESHRLLQDPVASLDVSILQELVLKKILAIGDVRKSERIDFVGGIRGLDELEKRVSKDMVLAFSMYPTSIAELIDVSDAGLLMPPKSTWFEPKLRSGLFIHQLK